MTPRVVGSISGVMYTDRHAHPLANHIPAGAAATAMPIQRLIGEQRAACGQRAHISKQTFGDQG
jgi:hypothetical protein